jgi:hypothetical protein
VFLKQAKAVAPVPRKCQTRYITGYLVDMIEQGIAAIDVRQDAHDRYIREVDDGHERLICGIMARPSEQNCELFTSLVV